MATTPVSRTITAAWSSRIRLLHQESVIRFSGLSRGWHYKAEAAGEIRMVAIRNRGAVRGVRRVAYDSVMDYIRRAMGEGASRKPVNPAPAPTITGELPLFSSVPDACA